MGVFYNRDKMWFGTRNYMQWIETPQTGADVSSLGFTANATNLQGGGYVRNSRDSHKVFQFSWGNSATPELASTIQAYRDGTYGRGQVFFHDPMHYDTNILPARVADPSMAINYEAEPLVRGVYPTGVPVSPTLSASSGLPSLAAAYALPAGYSSETDGTEILIPVPPGFSIRLGIIYGSSAPIAQAGFYWRDVNNVGVHSPIDPVQDYSNMAPTPYASMSWLAIGMQNRTASPQTVTVGGMIAQAQPPGEWFDNTTRWMRGQGHSGCDFRGDVSTINYNGVNGGQIGLACTLEETGAWA